MKTSVNIIVGIILIFISFSGFAHNPEDLANGNENWIGWRGLKQQGISYSDSLPLEWSNNKNIKWKTAIPGSGYSSSIVLNNNIYLTTSYKSESHNLFKRIISFILHIFNIIILIWLVMFISWRLGLSIDFKSLIYLAIFSITILLIVLLGIFSENLFNYQVADTNRWIVTSFILFLTFFSTSFFFDKKTILIKRIIGISLIALIIYFFLFMPKSTREHMFFYGYFSNKSVKSYFLYFLNFIYFLAAISIIFNLLPLESEQKLITKTSVIEKPYLFLRNIIFWISNLILVALLILIVIIVIDNIEYLSSRHEKPVIKPVISWIEFVYAIVLGVLFVILLSIKQFRKILNYKLLSALKVLLLLNGISYFIFINHVSDGNNYCRAIVSVNSETGNINWISEGLYGPLGSLKLNSPATPTPVTNGTMIFGYFGTSGLFACDLNGKTKWRNTDLPFSSYYGIGTSPTIYKNKIIVFSDSPNQSYLVVLDAESGKELWKKDFVPIALVMGGSSRTPMVKTINGTDMIFIWRWDTIGIYNLENGREISQFHLTGSTKGDLVSSLIVDSTNVYLADHKCCRAININSLISGNDSVQWETKIRGPNIPSPILVNKLLFILNDRGTVYCVQSADGKIIWKENLPGRFYYSSPVANGGYVYFTDNEGHTTVVKASRSFEIVSENKLDCDIHASVTPFKDKLFIRSFNELICILKN